MSLLTAPISRALIDELEKRFPPRRPLPGETIAEIMEHSGERKMIEYIRASHDYQQENL